MPTFPDMPSDSTYQPEKLSQRHNRILRMKVQGIESRNIALAMGISEAQVRYVCDSTLGRDKARELMELEEVDTRAIQRRISELAPMAVDQYRDVLNGDMEVSPALRMKVAGEVLDRTGHGRIQIVKGRFEHEHTARIGLDRLKERAMELGLVQDSIEAEFEEVMANA